MKFNFRLKSATAYLFVYFFILAALGTLLLRFPIFYNSGKVVPFIDSLFTTVSAICVTGLSTVDMSVYTDAGFFVIMLLIEAGGLGLVSFFTIYLMFASKKISLLNRNIIKDYFTEDSQIEVRQIIKLIVCLTFGFQLIGGTVLAIFLKSHGEENFIFYGLFLAVSAFCNAGFAPYSDSLAQFAHSPEIYLVIAFLIIAGGLGFTVMTNIFFVLRKPNPTKQIKKSVLTLHSKIVIFMTFSLIFSGTLIFFIAERKGAFSEMGFFESLGNAFFQSVTLRTAGFETVSQSAFSPVSVFVSNLFMLIGGSPGSMAGGIKTTTIFLILCIAYKSTHDKSLPSVFHRDISEDSIGKAVSVFVKALCFLGILYIFLLWSESKSISMGIFTETDLLFEVCSALGTVGLSRGLTPNLSIVGKILVIVLMFAGRTGITFIALNKVSRGPDINALTDYPKETVILG